MIDADISVYRDWKPASDLNASERLLAAHAIAKEAGVILADYKNIAKGHRLAIYAHLVALMQFGDDQAPYITALMDNLVNTNLFSVLPANEDKSEPRPT